MSPLSGSRASERHVLRWQPPFWTLSKPSAEQPWQGECAARSGAIILDPFWGSGRILASERVLGGVWGGSGAILEAKMGPTWPPKWPQVGPQIAQKSILADSGSRPCLGNRLGRLRNDFGTQNGPNLSPKMGPTWSQNRTKIGAKMDHFVDTFKNSILKDFCWIFGGKMEPSWGQDRIKNRSYLEMCEKRKTIVKLMKFQ